MRRSPVLFWAIIISILIISAVILLIWLSFPNFQSQLAAAQATRDQSEIEQTGTASAEQTQEAFLTITAEAIALLTKNAPTITPTPTLTPSPTSTPTSTPTFTPTPTLAPTLTPTLVVCSAVITGGNRQAFVQPSRGRMEGSVIIPNGQEVMVDARLADSRPGQGWWRIQYQGQTLWMLAAFFADAPNKPEPHCDDVHVQPFTQLRASPSGYITLLEDTFFDNANEWQNGSGLFPTLTQDSDILRDYYLHLNSSRSEVVAEVSPGVELIIDDFELLTSVTRPSDTLESYVGVRFRISEDRTVYYELRIMQNCQLQLYRLSEGMLMQIAADNGVNLIDQDKTTTCDDRIEDYIQVQVAGDELRVQVNDRRYLPINLPQDELGEFAQGGIELISFTTDAKFYFVSIMSPLNNFE